VTRLWFATALWKRILLGLVLGVIAGLILQDRAVDIKWLGDAFIRLIRMLVVPLVFITIVAGVVGLEDPRRLGSIGIKTLFLYLVTALLAIGVGLTMGSLVQPGLGVDFAQAVPREVEDRIALRAAGLTRAVRVGGGGEAVVADLQRRARHRGHRDDPDDARPHDRSGGSGSPRRRVGWRGGTSSRSRPPRFGTVAGERR
jgi:hypothetical protein